MLAKTNVLPAAPWSWTRSTGRSQTNFRFQVNLIYLLYCFIPIINHWDIFYWVLFWNWQISGQHLKLVNFRTALSCCIFFFWVGVWVSSLRLVSIGKSLSLNNWVGNSGNGQSGKVIYWVGKCLLCLPVIYLIESKIQ